jgi:hypothetical protein
VYDREYTAFRDGVLESFVGQSVAVGVYEVQGTKDNKVSETLKSSSNAFEGECMLNPKRE